MSNQLQCDVVVGVDIGKASHGVHAQTWAGQTITVTAIKKGKVSNVEAKLDALFAEICVPGKRVVVAVDQPGSYARLVCGIAWKHGVTVAYVPGIVAHRAAELFPGQAKTDLLDARVLARVVVAFGDSLQVISPDNDELHAELAALCALDEDFRSDYNRCVCRLRDVLLSIHPPLEAVVGPHLNSPGIQAVLSKWSTPEAIRTAGRPRVKSLLMKHHPRIGARISEDIFAALDQQSIVLSGTRALGQAVAEHAAQIETICKKRAVLQTQIAEVFKRHPFALVLLSMRGIGNLTGPRAAVEIGDITRFKTPGEFAGYIGVAPITRQSGSSMRFETRSRRGNHTLKNVLFTAAQVSTLQPGEDKDFYNKKRAEKKNHNAAVICLANRKARALWHMLTKNQTYLTKPERESLRHPPEAA
jgi:transposase